MHLDRYVHPEFGLLSPTPRLRRELRMAFFSVLLGIAIGAAAVIAISGNNNGDDARVAQGASSASVISEQPAEAVLGHNSPQAAGSEKELDREHTSKPDGSTAEAKTNASTAETKTTATTTCEGNNSSCRNLPPSAGKPRGMQMPAANDALAIGRAPLGRRETSLGTTSAAASSASSDERPPEHSTADRSESRAGDPPESKRLTHKNPPKKPSNIARNPYRPRQDAPNYEDRAPSWIGRGHERPVGELGRAYSLDRSFGQKGFWDWSR
jgi:hypothetical protein